MTQTPASTPAVPQPPQVSSIAKAADTFNYTVDNTDIDLFTRKLRSFVPPNGFDAHVHWYDLRHLSPGTPDNAFPGRLDMGFDAMLKHQSLWMGDRVIKDSLAFPFPCKHFTPDDFWPTNDFLIGQLKGRPNSRGLMLIHPRHDPAQVEAYLDAHPQIRGFKVYHFYAPRPDTFNADQSEFLPEWAWEIANKRGLWITMHMVLNHALGDARNQRYIRERCIKYPGAILCLAHMARGFNGYTNVESIDSIKDLANVVFDTSAICEPHAFECILKTMGTRRVMYGSDFPISEMRGKAMSIGDGFLWLYDHNFNWSTWTLGRHTLAGIESLLAFKQACKNLGLFDTDIQRLFGDNARQTLGIAPTPTGDLCQNLYKQAKEIIPGGTQLLSKRPEMFAPDQWPSYYTEAHGCEVVDIEGRSYIDMSYNSVGACILGYADPDVNAAVVRRISLGQASVLNCPEEVELAKLLMQTHPWAQMSRFARGGGEAMAIAVRIARAATARDEVIVCGYHGWNDWYLAANVPGQGQGAKDGLSGHLLPGLDPAGVPQALAGTTHTFMYNKVDQLKKILEDRPSKIAAVVMETTRNQDPEPGFLEAVRDLCDKHGARLVFDEVSIGWRLALGGAHMKYKVYPDLAVFAKALGNGFPISAVIGKAATMQAAQGSFISSSYWTEGTGSAAAVATIKKMMIMNVPSHINRIGEKMRTGVIALAKTHGLTMKTMGHPCWAVVTFDGLENYQPAALQTYFTAKMLKHGFLTGAGFYPMMSHQDRHIDAYHAASDIVLHDLAASIKAGTLLQDIGGPVKHTGFARLA